MSWLISRALMEAYANSPSSPGLVAEYSAGTCSDGELSALLSGNPTPQVFLQPDKTTRFWKLSRYGMTFAVDFLPYRCRMGTWIKNIDTAKSLTVLSAARSLSQETKVRRSNVAQTHVVVSYRQKKRLVFVPFAGWSFCHLGQLMRRVLVHVAQLFVYPGKSLIQWLRCGTDSPCSAAHLSQDAYETRLIGRRHCLGILWRNCGLTLKNTLNQACHGAIMAKGMTNGV